MRDGDRDQKRLKTLEYYLKIEDGARSGNAKDQALLRTLKGKGRWPAKPDSFLDAFDGLRNWYGKSGQHWEDANGNPSRAIERPEDPELFTRHEIQIASPDLLVTNYSMLEYMLLRPIERDIFSDTRAYYEAHPDETFFLILDEAHLYRGANGTEVAYLIRRVLDRLASRIHSYERLLLERPRSCDLRRPADGARTGVDHHTYRQQAGLRTGGGRTAGTCRSPCHGTTRRAAILVAARPCLSPEDACRLCSEAAWDTS
jgi:hypothetical protein